MFRTSSGLTRSAGLLGLALVLLVFSGAVCPDDDELIGGTATVRYESLEGGFYLIVTDGGEDYDPINLAPEYRQDGLRVRFKAKPAKGWVSSHMVAPLIEITDIHTLGPEGRQSP
jgi:hypothetical protein